MTSRGGKRDQTPRRGVYAELLRLPEARRIVISALIARLPIGMLPLALLLLARGADRSYADAGALVAAYTVATAVAAPFVARTADRKGQRAVLLPRSLAFPAVLVALCVLVAVDAPLLALVAISAGAGAAVPPISPSIRALWSRLAPPDAQYSAFAFEAALQELIFISGPLVVALLVLVGSPTLAVVVAAASGGVGAALFASTKASRSWRPTVVHTTRRFARLLPAPRIRGFLAFTVSVGVAWGAILIGVPAFSEEHATRGQSGIALAALSVGSVLGAIFAGRQRGASGLSRMRAGSVLIVVTLLPPILVSSQTAMVAAMFVAGLPMAPATAGVYSLVNDVMEQGREMETFAWCTTAMTGGTSLGLSISGVIVEHQGIDATFALGMVAVALGAAWAWIGPRPRRGVCQAAPVRAPVR